MEITLRHGSSPLNLLLFSEHVFIRKPVEGCFCRHHNFFFARLNNYLNEFSCRIVKCLYRNVAKLWGTVTAHINTTVSSRDVFKKKMLLLKNVKAFKSFYVEGKESNAFEFFFFSDTSFYYVAMNFISFLTGYKFALQFICFSARSRLY